MAFGFLLMGKDFLSLFLSSLVTVMYSLESYEGPALHLFKEFRDEKFMDGTSKVKENVAGVIRSYSWIREEFLLHLNEGNR